MRLDNLPSIVEDSLDPPLLLLCERKHRGAANGPHREAAIRHGVLDRRNEQRGDSIDRGELVDDTLDPLDALTTK